MQAALVKRHRLQQHPDLKSAVRKVWKVLTGHRRKGHKKITKLVYSKFLRAVQRALMPDIEDEDAEESIEVSCA